jgi:isochorismate hydrolase
MASPVVNQLVSSIKKLREHCENNNIHALDTKAK